MVAGIEKGQTRYYLKRDGKWLYKIQIKEIKESPSGFLEIHAKFTALENYSIIIRGDVCDSFVTCEVRDVGPIIIDKFMVEGVEYG